MTRSRASPPLIRGSQIPGASALGPHRAVARAAVPFAGPLLDQVETVALVGSYSLDIATAGWVSSKGFDAICGIDASFVRSPEGWASLIHPADRSEMVAHLTDDVLARGGALDAQYRVVRADSGEERWVQGHGMLLLDASGRPVTMLGTIADITDRRQAEASRLRMSELAVRAAEIAKVGAWELEIPTMRFVWSPELYRILEVDPKGRPGLQRAIDLYSPEARPVVQAAVQAVIDNGRSFDLELPMVTATGRPLWVRSQGSATMEGGRAVLAQGIIHDITGRKEAEIELQASEARTRDLIDGSGDGILVSDASGRYIEANPAVCRMLGYSRTELLGMSAGDLTADDDPLGNAGMDGRLAEASQGTGILVERRYRKRDGSSLPVEVRFRVLADGRQQRNVRDVEERTRADQERAVLLDQLLRSQRNLSEAQRIAHIGSWEWDLATGAAHRSEELHRIYGAEPGSIPATAEAFYAFVHPDDRARVRATEKSAIENGEPYVIDYRGVQADGSIRLIHDEAEVFRDASGAPVRMVGTVQDVTQSTAADAERARLAAALEQTADAVWIKDAAGSVVAYVNRSFSRLYGYEPHEIVGRWAGILHSGRHEHHFFEAITAAVSLGDTWSGSIINRRKDGALVEVDAVISGIRDASGVVAGFMQTDRDVTRERALERELERRALERDMVTAALDRIDSSASPESIATDACAEMIRLPDVDSAFVLGLDGAGHGFALAVAGPLAAAFATDREIPTHRMRYLLRRAADGPWMDDWHRKAKDGAYGERVGATGLRAVAYAPLRGRSGIVGFVGLASHAPEHPGFVDESAVLTTLASILGTLLSPGLESRNRAEIARAAVQVTLDASAFTPFFQPIVELDTGGIVGYEALSRFSNGVAPDAMFRLAVDCGLGLQLETATLRAALQASAVLPVAAYLSLNASPALILSGALRPVLSGTTRRIFIEITEHVAIHDYAALRAELAALGTTVGVSVDDAGAGFASLHHILELAPDLVKLDMSLVRGIDADPARQALIAGMGYFAVKRKLRLIAEGIETRQELDALLRLGIRYGQGYLLGHPTDGRAPEPWASRITSLEMR